jgi:triosephosphate isomerase
MKHLFVANWKMHMSNENAINYCINNLLQLKQLAHDKNIVICPPFTALSSSEPLLQEINISLGAQDCSAFSPGAYTGQIAAQHLAEIGCTYCIIGHSERRIYCGETNEMIAEKTNHLLKNAITPIICIGETSAECIVEATYQTLEKQLLPIFAALHNHTKKSLVIAYEPAWAIGAGIVPSNAYLAAIFSWLHKHITEQLADYNITLLYGGSVDEHTITQLLNIQHINGFLIGKASTHFEQFKSIIKACDTIL